MGRFLVVVPPLTGHVNPTVAVGHALASRGHEVAWVGYPTAIGRLLPSGATLLPLDETPLAQAGEVRARADSARGLLAFKQLWEDFFVPLARWMRPGVDAAAERYRPDVMWVDQQAFAGALVARQRELTWATSATTSARLADSLIELPKVQTWVEGQWAALEREAGLPAVPEPDLSPRRVILFSTEALAGTGRFPPQTAFVGPALEGREDATPFAFESMGARPRLLVSLGTVNSERGAPLYRVLREALGGQAVHVIVAAPPEQVGQAVANFQVQPRIPQLRVLPHVDAVLCHGGHNTVCEALAYGLPLVVMPIRDDQPVIAEQVVKAGVGLRLRFGRTRPDELRAAVNRVLTEPSFRAAAARVQDSFRAAGGARAAADALEALL